MEQVIELLLIMPCSGFSCCMVLMSIPCMSTKKRALMDGRSARSLHPSKLSTLFILILIESAKYNILLKGAGIKTKLLQPCLIGEPNTMVTILSVCLVTFKESKIYAWQQTTSVQR